MRRILLMLLMTLMSTVAFATGQASDVIYIDGQRWWLMGRPVGADSLLYKQVRASLPDKWVESSANWDGFYGYWTLDGDQLILDSVTYEIDDDDDGYVAVTMPSTTMRKIFADHYRGGKIVATWITGELRVAQGEMLLYEHGGWLRHYETEMFLALERGLVTKSTLYHNCVVADGLNFRTMSNSQYDDFKAGFKPTLRNYHELDTVTKVFFIIENCKADSLGHILDVDVSVEYKDHQGALPELAEEFKQYLMSLHPWRTIRLYGDYVAIWNRWYIAFRLDE